jgi:diguanylate cyclase (GGDEF)-like protein/PAS domain S-box-containing protein
VSLACDEFGELQERIRQLEIENRNLAENCESLYAMQNALEQVIGDSNQKLLAAEMVSMELEQVFSSCADAIWVIRQDGIVVRANEAMCQFLRRPSEEVVGFPCKDLLNAGICHDGRCPLKTAHKPQAFHEYDIERMDDTGALEHYLLSTASLVTLDGSRGIVGQFKDITLRKHAEAALARANVALAHLARFDELTQVANRRCFDETFTREWQRLAREKAPLSLVMCDIDCFKNYNDHYGHQAGDDCLRQVAQVLAGSVNRSSDLAARYGGEEFVFLLPQTPLEGAREVAEKARREVENLGLQHETSIVQPTVTLSLGVASLVPEAAGEPGALIRAADAALYKAKQAGRNRVMIGKC